jgi:thiol-disulfide isomerase/thioredoxin
MAKRAIPVVLVAVLLALAAWLAPALLDAPGDAAPGQTAAEQANPPLGGSVVKFTPASPARPAPAAVFRDETGREVSLADFRDKLVLLNFWATWCAPCLRELPSLDRLQGTIGDERFTVLALSIDRNGLAAVKPFQDQLAIRNLAIYLDSESKAARAFGVKGLPLTVLVGSDGMILGELLGPAEWDSPEARALIDFYLARLTPAAP